MTIKEIRALSGMSRAAFAREYNIPLRSIENWESEARKCPNYVTQLLEKEVKRRKEICMRTIEIYCNYGVLSKEKINVYTFGAEHPHVTCSDKMIVAVPEGWDVYENQMGQTMVTAPWGWDYEINEVLQGSKEPCFCAMDKDMKKHKVYLKQIL